MTKEQAYILGFIWADGWIRKSKYHNEIRVECLKTDIDEIYPYFIKENPNWKIYCRNRSNRKPQARLNLVDKSLVLFLYNNDYTSNSSKPASAILSHIPDKLKPYWFRGLIDGDGCWYYKDTLPRKRKFEISSNYEQDWSYFTNLLDDLKINYQYYQYESKKGNKSSRIELGKKQNLITLGEYIYKDFNLYPLRIKKKI